MRTRFSVTRRADASAAAGTSVTMLRLLSGANLPLYIYKIGIFFDSVSASDHQAQVDLKHETTASTPTGTAVSSFAALDGLNATSYVTCTVKCTAEGSPVYGADFENWLGPATAGIIWEYSLGNELVVPAGDALRVKVNMPTTAINLTYFGEWAE